MKTNLSVILTVFFAVTCSLIQSGTIGAQPKSKDYYGMNYCKSMVFIPGDESVAPFFISDKPVTNKEYILYLVWTNMVFGDDYPEVIFNIIPGFNASAKPDENFSPFADSASFRYYLDHSESYVSEYIFNPYYLNSAVIGITWEQANKYCHWLSDRYNEYSLIKGKIMELYFEQRNENNFSTESYLLRQYEGLVRYYPPHFFENPESGFKCVDYLLKPSFHIAARFELQAALKQFKLVDCFCASTKDADFLKPWYENFLPENKGYIYFNSPFNEISFWMHSDDIKNDIKLPGKISEWCFDSYIEKEEKTIPDIYRSFGYDVVKFLDPANEANSDYYPVKDRFGNVQVIITGENKERGFEMIKAPVSPNISSKTNPPYIFDHNTGTVVKRNGDIFTCFRYAVNAIKR